MKKFVYRMQEGGKDFFLKAENLKSAKQQLKKTFGGLPYMVAETNYRTARMPISQAQYEHVNA